MFSKDILFLHDNAPAHNSLMAIQTVRVLGFELHVRYSPDLALAFLN